MCDNKWAAQFKVKHCFKCGVDERVDGKSMTLIKRTRVSMRMCSDGISRISLRLAMPREEISGTVEENAR